MQALEYQKKAVLKTEEFEGRVLIAADMGLGKTAMSFWILLRNRIDSWPAVVVCPAAVKYNWEHTASLFGVQAFVAEGQKQLRPGHKGFTSPKMIIINYDILQYWMDFIQSCKPKTLVIDESQNLCNRDTIRTKKVKQLSRVVKNVIALSGTPLLNCPSELWPTLNIIRPKEYRSFLTFAQRYCGPKLTQWGWDYSGSSRLPELHEKLRSTLMIRILKKDVMKDLPDKVRNVIPVEISDRKEYEFAKNNFLQWMQQNHKDKLAKAKKAKNLTQIGYLLRLCAKLKLRAVVEWCNKFLTETDEKLVVFAIHHKMIEALDRRLLGGKHVIINSTLDGRERQAGIKQFMNDPGTRVIIGNIQAMGTGVDGLQRASSTSVITELPWQPGALNQLEDRTHRIGQNNTAWYYYLVASGTIEERLCEVLQRKQNVVRSVLDGGIQEEDLNILDELLNALEDSNAKERRTGSLLEKA